MKITIIAASLVIAAAASYAAAPPADAGSVTLNFPNTDVNEVLLLYESLTHFKIIRDNFVQGKIMVVVAEPVARDKAVEIIERTLFANGFAIIQIDPDTIEIIGVGHNARSTGVPTISDPKHIPTQERLISTFSSSGTPMPERFSSFLRSIFRPRRHTPPSFVLQVSTRY